MLSKTTRVALFFGVAVCTSFAPSLASAYAQDPPQTGLPAVRGGARARSGDIASAASIAYSQPPASTGELLHSSWLDPDRSDDDEYVWDNFTLLTAHSLTEIRWRGGYDPANAGSGGPVIDITVAIYPSIPAGIQPDVVNPPLVEYNTGGNANETPAGTFGGVAMYDYTFTLPTPFLAIDGIRYWVQIEAWQHGSPDWGIAEGTGSEGVHFRRVHSGVSDIYQTQTGDAAFTLLGTPVTIYRVYLPQMMREP